MKYVIIGGGIAGTALAILLQRKGRQAVVAERLTGHTRVGHGFLVHAEAVSILAEIGLPGGRVPGEVIRRFRLMRPDGLLLREENLDCWSCMRRDQLMDYLKGLLLPDSLLSDRQFSGFIRDGHRAVGARFDDGRIEQGDVFIGADGARSQVRQQLFGKTVYSPVRVKEIVGICSYPALAEKHARQFLKFQRQDCGLSFGLIPTGPGDLVWFMQYDPTMGDVPGEGGDAIAAFCRAKLRGFPDPVAALLTRIDFRYSYVWHTQDFDPLPAFHRHNVVLLGDAAQQVLPFTSAGTSNALLGAKALADGLTAFADPQMAFRSYYEQRAFHVKNQVQLGRKMSHDFLHPVGDRRMEEQLPLVPTRPVRSAGVRRDTLQQPSLRMQYFTDPVCSTCWIVQPAMQKIMAEYGQNLGVTYHMGGLLPSWETIRGKIQSPDDAARHWQEVAVQYQFPINPTVWKEDPLASSFPPSIAFKAALLQDEDKAVLFLRRLREMLFLEAKNISRWQHLAQAAIESGLDWQTMLADLDGEALRQFRLDLRLAHGLGISSFPTIILISPSGQTSRVKGYFEFEELEALILGMLSAEAPFTPGLHRVG